MFQLLNTDIFTVNASAYVNPVNCVGIMGAGLAKQFLSNFPEINNPYKKACEDRTLVSGICQWIPLSNRSVRGIINFPTKQHWREHSKPEYIYDGMVNLVSLCSLYNLNTVAMPLLGCGLGQLKIQEVLDIIIETTKYSSTYWLIADPQLKEYFM